jgi:hypothetical protein
MRRVYFLMALLVVCSLLTVLYGPMAMAQSPVDSAQSENFFCREVPEHSRNAGDKK